MAEFIKLPTRSIGLKFLLVCALALVMAVPTLSVWAVLFDRQQRQSQVSDSLAQEMGGPQTVLGPVLLVPYQKLVETTTSDGRQTRAMMTGEAVAFAETGVANGRFEVEKRSRGIYAALVYRGDVSLTAQFNRDAILSALNAMDPSAQYDWTRARIAMGLTSTAGLPADINVVFPGGQQRLLKPANVAIGAAAPAAGDYRSSAFSLVAAPAGDLIGAGGAVEVRADFKLTGALRFAIAAFANNTSASIASAWPHPSFEGLGLPDRSEVSASGFSANWSTGLSKRGLPEVSNDPNVFTMLSSREFAVKLVEPTNIYTGVDRALKYSIMFIGLVFLTYFMFEIVSGSRAHPAQYIMVGLAQAIFYLLLLAFAEQVGFTIAFVIAAAATVALISLYVAAVFRARLYVLPAFLTFTLVYALMYVLMQLEEFSLLVGALMSFAALAALMYLTRNVAWYGAADAREEGAKP